MKAIERTTTKYVCGVCEREYDEENFAIGCEKGHRVFEIGEKVIYTNPFEPKPTPMRGTVVDIFESRSMVEFGDDARSRRAMCWNQCLELDKMNPDDYRIRMEIDAFKSAIREWWRRLFGRKAKQ